MVQRRCFKEVRRVRVLLRAETYVRMHALGIRLYAIGGRCSYPSIAVAFSADGEDMDHPNRSWPERWYPDKVLNETGLPSLHAGFATAGPQHLQYEIDAGRNVQIRDN